MYILNVYENALFLGIEGGTLLFDLKRATCSCSQKTRIHIFSFCFVTPGSTPFLFYELTPLGSSVANIVQYNGIDLPAGVDLMTEIKMLVFL